MTLRTKRLCTVLATVVAIVMLIVGAMSLIGNKNVVSAENAVYTKVSQGDDWEGKYGSDGYFIFGIKGAYTNLYDEGGDGLTDVASFRKQNQSIATGSAISGTMKASSPVSIMGHTMNHVNRDGQTNTYFTNNLVVGGVNNNTARAFAEQGNDVIVWMTTKVANELVTLYIPDGYESRVISADNPVTVSAYYSEEFKSVNKQFAQTSDLTATSGISLYATAPDVVTDAGNFVTFKTGATGTYYFVIHSSTARTGTCTGIFFDKIEAGTELVYSKAEGSVWEGKYGADGYLVFAGGGIYTDQVADNDGKTLINTGTSNSPTSYVSAGKVGTLKEGAIFSEYGTNGSFLSTTSQNRTNLYAPGTTTEINTLRFHNSWRDGGFLFWVDVTAENEYVTLYIPQDWDKKMSASNPIGVSMWIGADPRNQATVHVGDADVQVTPDTLVDSGATRVSETATVTVPGTYVTFKTTTPTRYFFLLENLAETPVSGTKPMLGGVFFDSEEPNNFTIEAAGVNVFGPDWQGAYGKDGYALIGNGYKLYSDMILDGSGNPVAEGTLIESSRTASSPNDNVVKLPNGYSYKPTAPIDLIGFNARTGGTTATNKNTLYIPGTKNPTNARIHDSTGGVDGHYNFTISFNVTKRNEYVTIYIPSAYGGTNREISAENYVNVHLFSGNEYREGTGSAKVTLDYYNSNFNLLATQKVESNDGTYVSFKLGNVGQYQFLIEDVGMVKPMFGGLLFDTALPVFHTVSYELNGGTNGANPTRFVEGKGVETLANPTKAENRFDGWFLESTFTNKVTSILPTVTTDITLYAKFTDLSRAITYELNGGTNGNNPAKFIEGVGVASFAEATKAHKVFEGWFAEPEFVNEITSISDTATAPITLYAKFVDIIHNISYVLNGGANTNPATYVEGDGIATLADATKIHKSFDGWYTDAEFTNKVTAISVDEVADITLYAKFSDIIHNITYVLDGAENSANNPATFVEGEGFFGLTSLLKEGYTFDGWYTDAEFTNKVTAISGDVDADVTLYAKFTEIPEPERPEVGCGSAIGSTLGLVSLVTLAGAAFVAKRKKED